MLKGEEGFITAILTQAVEDARYIGSNKYMIKQKFESITWIMSNDPQFNYYCKLINIEPSYIQNKIKKYKETRFTKEQKPIVQMLERKNNESRRIRI